MLTHETALEVLEARMVVEVELAGLAAERATASDFHRLETILKRLKRAVSRGQPTAQITSAFHQALTSAGHNAVLAKMANLLTRPPLAQGFRVEHALPDIMAGEYDSHLLLYQAVRTGDPTVARRALREHLEIAPVEIGIADTRRAGDYYRIVGERLLWGGRISMGTGVPRRLARRLGRDIARVYPSLKGVEIEYA